MRASVSIAAMGVQEGAVIHLWNDWENCSVLMSWESKPEVISTPMQHTNKKMYMTRRFGFLYHGTLSSSTRRVTMGSAVLPMLTFGAATMIATGLADAD